MKNTISRKIFIAFFATIAFTPFLLCSCKEKKVLPVDDINVIHRWEGSEVTTLDPHLITGFWEGTLSRDLFLGLIADGPDGAVIAGSAESWQTSQDGKVYTFYLRKDARWSDGTAVTANDFEYAFRRILNPATASRYASILYSIQNAQAVNSGKNKDITSIGVKAIDDYTLQITLETPTPYFLSLLKHHTAYPVPKHVLEKFGKQWVDAQNFVNNGAFMLKEWKAQEYVHLVKNPHFYDAASIRPKEVYFHSIQDHSTALKRFRAGELDMCANIPPDQYEWIKSNLTQEFHETPRFASHFYVMNQKRKPFQDKRVREALAMSVDREAIADKVMGGGQVPAYSLVPFIKGYNPAEMRFKNIPMHERLKKAKQLLSEAGYGDNNPLKFEIRYISHETGKKTTTAIQGMWKEIGIEASLASAESGIHYTDISAGNFDVAMAPWIGDYPDAQNFLMLLEYPNPLNYGSYNNEKFNALMRQASKITDFQKRALVMQEAEQLALDDAAIIPALFPTTKVLINTKIKGYEDNTENIHATRWLSK